LRQPELAQHSIRIEPCTEGDLGVVCERRAADQKTHERATA
jgi:hypothetical protein